MEIGRRWHGADYPICRLESGCTDPVDPLLRELTSLEQQALEVFSECQTQWDVVAGIGGGGRVGLKYSSAEVVCRSHGYEWSEDMLRMLRICEVVSLKQQAAKAEIEKASRA